MKIRVHSMPEGRRRQAPAARGFTLLEVLVAIVVLSFGVLGVVGLQAAALQANKEARYQSTAVALGRELGDMMRGNKNIALQTTSNPYLVSGYSSGDSLPTASTNCMSAVCSASALASYNMNDWLGRVNTALPGARVVVCADSQPYSTADGLPQWSCTGAGMLVVKIGWSRQSTNAAATDVERAVGGRPSVLLPLIPGS